VDGIDDSVKVLFKSIKDVNAEIRASKQRALQICKKSTRLKAILNKSMNAPMKSRISANRLLKVLTPPASESMVRPKALVLFLKWSIPLAKKSKT